MLLIGYIAQNFASKAEFGRLQNPPVTRQQVEKWIKAGRIVWGGRMYSPKQQITLVSESKNEPKI